MKKAIFTLLIILICLKAFACPCYYCPIESKPDTARVITQKIWLKSVRTNGINGNRLITVGKSLPRVFFNSIALRFPKNKLQLAAFKLRLEHRVFDSTDFWGSVTLKNEVKDIKQDEHVNNDLYDQSCLYFAGNDCYSFEIEQIGGWAPDSFEVEIKLIFVPPLHQKITKSLVLRAECSKPFPYPYQKALIEWPIN